jgi:penicillin-binding protein 1A
MGVEGDQQLMGNGTSQDYVPADIKPEDLAPESQIDTNKLPAFSPKKNNNTPKNGTTPPTPKAILPKKVGGNIHQ